MLSDTRSALIEQATDLVRRRGYSAFSYADLSEAVGIRKASIHHHFPAKEDLGLAIVEAYAMQFAAELGRIERLTTSLAGRLIAYADLYRAAQQAGQGCLCGVLASEHAILPERMQASVSRFFDMNLAWLERMLEAGGVDSARRDARLVLSSLQGALSVARGLQDPEALDDAAAALVAKLAPA